MCRVEQMAPFMPIVTFWSRSSLWLCGQSWQCHLGLPGLGSWVRRDVGSDGLFLALNLLKLCQDIPAICKYASLDLCRLSCLAQIYPLWHKYFRWWCFLLILPIESNMRCHKGWVANFFDRLRCFLLVSHSSRRRSLVTAIVPIPDRWHTRSFG